MNSKADKHQQRKEAAQRFGFSEGEAQLAVQYHHTYRNWFARWGYRVIAIACVLVAFRHWDSTAREFAMRLMGGFGAAIIFYIYAMHIRIVGRMMEYAAREESPEEPE